MPHPQLPSSIGGRGGASSSGVNPVSWLMTGHDGLPVTIRFAGVQAIQALQHGGLGRSFTGLTNPSTAQFDSIKEGSGSLLLDEIKGEVKRIVPALSGQAQGFLPCTPCMQHVMHAPTCIQLSGHNSWPVLLLKAC
jgi:hypothetical protein